MYSLFLPVPPLRERIAATLDLVQQHKHSFSPAPTPLPAPLLLSCYRFISVYVLKWCHTRRLHTPGLDTGAIRINDALLRPESISDSYQTSTVSHLWLLLVPYQAWGEPWASAPKKALYLWNVYFIVRVGSPFALQLSTCETSTHSVTQRLDRQNRTGNSDPVAAWEKLF